MSSGTIGVLGIVVLFVLLILRIPVAFAMFVVGFFGIAVREELQGALKIGEQNRNLLALAFNFVSLRKNLFGQTFWKKPLNLIQYGLGGEPPGRQVFEGCF